MDDTQQLPTTTVNTPPQVPVQTTPVAQPVTTQHQAGKYLIEVIREKCISAASCVAIAPGTFDLDEGGIAEILSQTGDDPDTQLLAAQSCPTAAIRITDTQTGEVVWPL